jgi:hypothetical protein
MGYVTKFGELGGLNTSGFDADSILYLSPDTPGAMTNTRPDNGEFAVILGAVKTVDNDSGSIIVDIVPSELTTEINGVRGWSDPTNTIIYPTSYNRTMKVVPASGSEFYYYQDGVKYISDGDTLVWNDTEGTVDFYYVNGELTAAYNQTEAQVREIYEKYPGISRMYWDATNDTIIFINNMRHAYDMNGSTWSALWDFHKCQILDGLGIIDIITEGSGSLDSHAQFGHESGLIRNQDILTSVPAIASTTGYTIFYREGVSTWRSDTNPGFPVLTAGTGRVAWNQESGGSWSLVEATNNTYVLMHLLVSNTLGTKTGVIVGQNNYSTITDARVGAKSELSDLLFSPLPIKEFAPIATVIFQTADTYTNAVQARTREAEDAFGNLVDFIDWRVTGVAGAGTGGATTSFLGSTDTPGTYAGSAGKVVAVNTGETGLEFVNSVTTINGESPTAGNYNIDFDSSKLGNNVTIDAGGSSIGTTFSVADADSVIGNEYQDLSNSVVDNNVTINITDGTGTTFSRADGDADATNELQNLQEVTDEGATTTNNISVNGGGFGSYVRSSETNADYNYIYRNSTDANTALFVQKQGDVNNGSIAKFLHGSASPGTGTEVLDIDNNGINVTGLTETVGLTSTKSIEIEATTAFDLLATNNGQDGIFIVGSGTTGLNNYGNGMMMTRVDGATIERHAGITSVQTGSDANNVGLAFFTHPSNTGSDPIVEQARFTKDGEFLLNRTTSTGETLQVEGTGIFSGNVSSNPAPTLGDHLTNKTYVDGLVSGSTYWTQSGGNLYPTTLTDNVGIGKIPTVELDVDGTIQGKNIISSLGASTGAIEIRGTGASGTIVGNMEFVSGFGMKNKFQKHDGSTTIELRSYGHSYFNGGNVSIGKTSDTGEKLQVEGTGIFSGNVSSNPAPTLGDHLTNKTYVDGLVGSFWTASGDDIYNSNVGNVGILTDSPDELLQVGSPVAGGDAYIKINANGGGYSAGIKMVGGGAGIWALDYSDVTNSLNINQDGTKYLTIFNGGNARFGSGTSDTGEKLQVEGDALVNGTLNTVTAYQLNGSDLKIGDLDNSGLIDQVYVSDGLGGGSWEDQAGGLWADATTYIYRDSPVTIGATTAPAAGDNLKVIGGMSVSYDTATDYAVVISNTTDLGDGLNIIAGSNSISSIPLFIQNNAATSLFKIDGTGKTNLRFGTSIDEFSIDGTLAGNSDNAVPTEKAVKTYVDAQVGGTPAGSSTQIQYNDAGSFGASADFTYNDTSKKLEMGATTEALFGGVSDAGNFDVQCIGVYNGGMQAHQISLNSGSGTLGIGAGHTYILESSHTYTSVSLPSASDNIRVEFVIVNHKASATTITTYVGLDGATKTTIPAQSSITVHSNGTNWYRIQ